MALDQKTLAAWLGTSIMAQRGVGRDAAGKIHHLTEEMQGAYHYTMGPYSDPVMTIKPGDTVVVDTRDAFEGKLTKDSDKPSEKLRQSAEWANHDRGCRDGRCAGGLYRFNVSAR